jgi:large subunit ribosomal protein L30
MWRVREAHVKKDWLPKGRKMDNTLRIILRKSKIGHPASQARVLAGLGLRRINQSVVRADTPTIRGMIRKVVHLVEIQHVHSEEQG